MKITGIVLAGGRSRRFGQDKALATVDNIPLIQRSIDLLEKISLEPVVITNETADYSFLGCRIERDLLPNQGPLGGLYTAMKLIGGPLLVLTCDMPYLEGNVLRKLTEEYQPGVEITFFNVEERSQPFPGIYESTLYHEIYSRIENNDLSMQGLLEQVSEKRMLSTTFPADLFHNVNEKKDLFSFK